MSNGKVANGLTSLQNSFTAADSTGLWYGSYAGYAGPYPDVPESDFIQNGVAKLPYIDQEFSYTNVSFDIPPAYRISGDSIEFDAVAKNPIAFHSIADYDVVLQMVGEEHSAELHFVADSSAKVYDQFYVGDKRVSNRPELVHYFQNMSTIRLILQKDVAKVYVDGVQLGKLEYGAANRIGKLKTINVAGKGFVVVNKVQLLNSYTNQPVLLENFNTDGHSHTIFY